MNINNKLNNAVQLYLSRKQTVSKISKSLNVSEQWFRTYLYTNNHRLSKKNKRREWTKSEIEYLKANYDNFHITVLCKHFKRPEISIRTKTNSLDLYKTKNHRLVTENMKELSRYNYLNKHKKHIELYLNNYKSCSTFNDMSKILNIHNSSIRQLIIRANLPNIQLININEYLNIYKNYNDIKTLSKKLNVSVISLNRFIAKNNLPKPLCNKKNKKWTTYEINKLRKLYKTHTIKECAILLKRTFEGVKSKIKAEKINKNFYL